MESTRFHTIGADGIRATLDLEVRNMIGGVALPDGWSKVAVVIAGPSQVTLTDAGGARLCVPFDGAFLRTGR
jgi:hypothetical protein